jgi:hypothetical protein
VHEVGRAALRSSIDRIRSRPRADPAARAALRRRIVEKLEETLTLSGNGKEVVSLTELGTDVSAEDAIEAFADCWHAGELLPRPGNVARLDLGPVSDQVVQRVESLYGVDISGRRYIVDTKGLLMSYGSRRRRINTKLGKLLLSSEVIALYRKVVERADIIRRPISKGRTKLIRFEKRIDGTLFVVRQRHDKSEEFALFDMWIKVAE